jgi:hypothetical protein
VNSVEATANDFPDSIISYGALPQRIPRLTADVTRGDEKLITDETRPVTELEDLRFSARSGVGGQGPHQLRAAVVVKNAGARSVTISYGCTPDLWLYRDSSRSSSPVWRSELRHPYVEPPSRLGGYVCVLVCHNRIIAPGDSAVLSVAYPLGEVIADSLPTGRYHVTAKLRLGCGTPPKTHNLNLNAGIIQLVVSPDYLPSGRTKDGVIYVARTRLIQGQVRERDTVRTLILVKNTSSQRRELDIAEDCPVLIVAYRAPLRYDLREPLPALDGKGNCEGVASYRFALEPGASWVFGRDVPVADFVPNARPGRYWIRAWMRDRSPSSLIDLSAGVVDIPR